MILRLVAFAARHRLVASSQPCFDLFGWLQKEEVADRVADVGSTKH
jgi:hypothetical protein